MKRPFLSIWVLPILVFLILYFHGALLGMSDDEAYYWVLSRKLAWGYAYHPPLVAWVIAFFEKLLTPLQGIPGVEKVLTPSGIVRFPAALISGILLFAAVFWMSIAGMDRQRLSRGALLFLAFPGLFGASWMMVPDLPLLLGWIGLFLFTWKVCFAKSSPLSYLFLGMSAAWAMGSKLSAVLLIFSSIVCIVLWGFPSRKWKALGAVIVGSAIGLVPFLIWNSQHEWGAILYQIRDRHSGASFSLVRYLRFWGILLVAVGPPLVIYFFMIFGRAFSKNLSTIQLTITRFFLVWILPPALVFCIQPAFSEFKPHWALMVFLPVALLLAYFFSMESFSIDQKLGKIQRAYGFVLMAVVFLACHFPIVPWVIQTATGHEADPRWDVTNDFYGWKGLPSLVQNTVGAQAFPILGSRYQTASQASFSWNLYEKGSSARISRVPRSLAEKDEWPAISVVSDSGPDWPRLLAPILYVADQRFAEPPQFKNAACTSVGRHTESRVLLGKSWPTKWIEVWRCIPKES